MNLPEKMPPVAHRLGTKIAVLVGEDLHQSHLDALGKVETFGIGKLGILIIRLCLPDCNLAEHRCAKSKGMEGEYLRQMENI